MAKALKKLGGGATKIFGRDITGSTKGARILRKFRHDPSTTTWLFGTTGAPMGKRIDSWSRTVYGGPPAWVKTPKVDTAQMEADAAEERRKRAALQRLLAGNRNLLRTAGGGNSSLGVGS